MKRIFIRINPSRRLSQQMSLEESNPQGNNKPTDFIREAVAEDLKSGRFNYVRTRLPPEPNGYLHIGHVKAFMIDYLIAKENGGELVLRFDDTNPTKEETEFVEAIEEDARWLGIEWVKVTYASDYFGLLYDWAVQLVKKGLAYVDDQTPEEVSANRGTLTSLEKILRSVTARCGRKFGFARTHEERRVPRWLANFAREDRHGASEHQHA
jgi:glutamyl/glutaminyl-tRNA synthetase